MQSMKTFTTLRRLGAALVAAAGMAAGLAAVPSAYASTVTVNGSSGTSVCTYGSFSGNTNGDFTFNNCVAGTSTPQPGVLSLNLTGTATSLAPNGTTSFAVARTGMTTGGGTATGNLTVTGGGCTINPSSVTFADGSSVPSVSSIAVTAGATAATSCTITLAAVTASLGSPSSTTINVVDPLAPVAFNFSAASSTANFGGAPVSITVTRTGGTAGAWDVPFTLSSTTGMVDGTGALVTGGGTITPTGKVSFPAGSGASQTITYSPPGTPPAGVTSPASIVITRGTPVETTATGQAQAAATITTHTITAQTLQGCATTATYTIPWNGSQTLVSQVKQNENAAVSNTTSLLPGRLYTGTISETSATGDKADVIFTVSGCPGDYSMSIGACAQHQQYTGGKIYYSVGPKPVSTPWYLSVCELPASTTKVYFNFRQVTKPTPVPLSAPGTPSCQWTTCPVYVQFN